VLGHERLDDVVAADLDAVAGAQSIELVVVGALLDLGGCCDEALESLRRFGRAVDAGADVLLHGAMGEEKGHPQRMVEVAVGEEDVGHTREAQRTPPGVEGDAGGVDSEPRLIAGARAAVDRQVVEAQKVRQISV
jgi:hypothetical protein